MSELQDIREQLAVMASRLDRLEGIRRQLGVEPLVARVVEAAAAVSGVSAVDIVSQRRDSRTVTARFAAIWAARAVTDYSLPRLGRAFGNRDHTTIMSALKAAAVRRRADPGFVILCDRVVAGFNAALELEGLDYATAQYSA